jgi:misacylated tRNA(Ala) deacylase
VDGEEREATSRTGSRLQGPMGPAHTGHTHRLDWEDPTLREWDCTVVWSDAADPDSGIILDRSAFYPGGGGQPPDHGVLIWQGVQTRIIGTRKNDDYYLIPAPGDPVPPSGTQVRGALDDERRTSLMRTHSGLHVLCGTVFRDFGAMVTGGNMEPGEARMDFNLPQVPQGFKQSLEDAVNAEIAADRAIVVRSLPREEANAIPDLVRTQFKAPPDMPAVRLVDIVGLDMQADGGTHVASTGQIGRIVVTKVESKGRQNRRVRIRLST